MSAFVTLEELLTEPEPIDIPTGKRVKQKGKQVDAILRVYPKRPTDTEKEMCLSAANAARRALRKELADEKSEKHQLLLLEPLQDADPDLLRQLWLNGQLLERAAHVQFNSLEEREYIPEPEGDVVMPPAMDAYMENMEGAETDRVKQLTNALLAIRAELEVDANSIPQEQLLQAAIPPHIETLTMREWNDTYTAHLIARCTFYDPEYTKPFKTVSQVVKLREQMPTVYQKLADTHRGLVMEVEPGLGN